MSRDGDAFFGLVVAVVIIAGSVWLGVAHYRECRRVHPAWYCLTGGGR